MPLNASSGVSPNRVQAMLSTSKIDVQGELAGLQSVASASATPVSRNRATGGGVVWRSVKYAVGNSTATVPAAARELAPAALRYSKWSADSAPHFAANSAAPMSLNCPACT